MRWSQSCIVVCSRSHGRNSFNSEVQCVRQQEQSSGKHYGRARAWQLAGSPWQGSTASKGTISKPIKHRPIAASTKLACGDAWGCRLRTRAGWLC